MVIIEVKLNNYFNILTYISLYFLKVKQICYSTKLTCSLHQWNIMEFRVHVNYHYKNCFFNCTTCQQIMQ